MKFRNYFIVAVVGACVAGGRALNAAPAAAAQAPKAPVGVAKAEPVEQEIPRSAFTFPHNPKEGRDPFFPNSMIGYSAPVSRTNVSVALAPPKMVLMGISGTRE